MMILKCLSSFVFQVCVLSGGGGLLVAVRAPDGEQLHRQPRSLLHCRQHRQLHQQCGGSCLADTSEVWNKQQILVPTTPGKYLDIYLSMWQAGNRKYLKALLCLLIGIQR